VGLVGHGREAGRTPAVRGKSATTATTIIGLALGMSVASAGLMYQRFADIGPELERFASGDAGSSMGQRVGVWQAALRGIAHAPLTGSGFERFDHEIDRQARQGEIPPTMKLHFRHAHNEFLCAFANGGVFAFLGVLGMFLLPALALWRDIRAGNDSVAARAALVGFIAFAGFALTDCMFDRQISLIGFFLINGWLLRAAHR
jgi:O-antigen ligase